MRGRSWAVTLAVAAGLSLPPRVALGADPVVAVGPVEYGGELPDYFRREIEQTLSQAIEASQGVVVELRVKSCSELECLREPAAQAEVAVVILPRVSEEDRNYRVELAAHAVDDGQQLARVELECPVCGQQELLDAIPAKVVELEAKISEALAARTGPARLAVEGTPSEAALALDGEDFGVSPAAREVPPGEHELEITAPGYAAQVHRWAAVAGVEELVEYELTPLRAGAEARRGLVIGGWSLVAAGLGGAAAGGVLLALDGREHNPTCSPGVTDINGACPNVYTTAVAGYLSLGLSVAALAVGAGLLIHARRRRAKEARVQLTSTALRVSF